MNQPTRTLRRRGFTLVELLVVIGILVVLMSLLLPAIGKIKSAAYAANTQQEITVITSAIERYYTDFRAYPGPFSNDMIANGQAMVRDMDTGQSAARITMTENLTLGLFGGLVLTQQGNVAMKTTAIGQGPQNLNPSTMVVRRQYAAYMDQTNMLSKGKFADAAGQANDSIIPELVDQFSSPMPILYLRARIGAPGVISNMAGQPPNQQYDIRQIAPYTQTSIGADRDTVQVRGNARPGMHGLTDAVNPTPAVYPYDGLFYFTNPSMPNSPRAKDGYILISAGKDRVYGTNDDICSFGAVRP